MRRIETMEQWIIEGIDRMFDEFYIKDDVVYGSYEEAAKHCRISEVPLRLTRLEQRRITLLKD